MQFGAYLQIDQQQHCSRFDCQEKTEGVSQQLVCILSLLK